ncbi:MAG: GntR family transcriptional regulator [Eubacterium sp.]|nr:GntR family transcriptional regulator [Eubacterium sp.]
MEKDLQLNMDAYLPLRDVVFQTLRSAILRGDLKPGERLMELQLASKLGVSRTPIREAIRMLEQEGLAITIPRRGAEVAKMTEKDMGDTLQIRRALEELAVVLVCDKITEEDVAELRAAMKHFEEMTKQDNVVDLAKADVALHETVYRIADNPKLVQLLGDIREQMFRYRAEYLKDRSIYPILIQEHRDMVDALEKRNKDLVVKITMKHLYNQEEGMKRIIRQQQ